MRRLCLLVALLTTAGCARGKQLGTAGLRPSDIEVYRAVLDSMFVPRKPSKITSLVVLDSTTVRRREGLVGGVIEGLYRLGDIDSTAVRDFETRNRGALSLAVLGAARLSLPIVLVAHSTLSSLPRNNADLYWEEFYRRYPGSGGQIALSAIGYSADGSIAVLMIDQGCGTMCGGGYMVSVRRSRGQWHIARIQGTWVS